jgi:DNA-directed RNA polymerase subunit K/omega
MSDIKSKVQNLDPNVKARNIKEMVSKTGNMFESLVIISKRSNQISKKLKLELQTKLEEFSVASDTIEEIHENKEQIEISKFYERLPNPSIIATEEFLNGELETKNTNKNSSSF